MWSIDLADPMVQCTVAGAAILLTQLIGWIRVHEYGHIIVGRALGYIVAFSWIGGPHAAFARGQLVKPVHRAVIAMSGAVATTLVAAVSVSAASSILQPRDAQHWYLLAAGPAGLALLDMLGLAISAFTRGADGWHVVEGTWFRREWDGVKVTTAKTLASHSLLAGVFAVGIVLGVGAALA